MPQASDLTVDSRFVALFVGQSGSGKTVAEGSFSEAGPVHFYDFDGRIRGLLGASWIDRKNITYDYFPPRMEGLIGSLNSKFDLLLAAARTGQFLPTTLVTDSLTNQNYAFICQSIPLTHKLKPDAAGPQKGKFIGAIAMPGPEDYGLEAQAAYDYMSFLKTIPIRNIITSAHLVDRYGKADPDNAYSESVVVGEKLSIRDKIGANIQTHYDHVFKFERETVGKDDRFYVTFRGGIARTSYGNLPTGRHDITGKSFYTELIRLAKGEIKG